MKTIKLAIIGMHCSACAMNIDFDLEDLEGVANAKTNYSRQICEVTYDEAQVSIQDILMQIKTIGYTAEVNDSH